MRHNLYRYFTERRWAEEFLDGKMRFRSLAYFRDYEKKSDDEKVRKDDKEGNLVFGPPEGLFISNQTQGTSGVHPGFRMESRTIQAEIFVLCASRYFSEELRDRFGAVVCVEILKITAFCKRIQQGLPQNATFFAGKVIYYDPCRGPEERWALPDLIARSKFKSYEWQCEYRQSGLPGLVIGLMGSIGRTATMAGDLPAHRRGRPIEASSNLTKLRAGSNPSQDVLSLSQCEREP